MDPSNLELAAANVYASQSLRLAFSLSCAVTGPTQSSRPPPWTDAHHRVHWADGGETSLSKHNS
ncbi:MAG: hypothetical protein NVSMB13_21060 [Mycobacteriales bacterium]